MIGDGGLEVADPVVRVASVTWKRGDLSYRHLYGFCLERLSLPSSREGQRVVGMEQMPQGRWVARSAQTEPDRCYTRFSVGSSGEKVAQLGDPADSFLCRRGLVRQMLWCLWKGMRRTR